MVHMQLVFVPFSVIDSSVVSSTSSKRTSAPLSLQSSVKKPDKHSSAGFIPVCQGLNVNQGGRQGDITSDYVISKPGRERKYGLNRETSSIPTTLACTFNALL